MVTALNESSDRVRGLEAGADDFLTKPINDQALFARVRSLTRIKIMLDELRLREETIAQFGMGEEGRAELDENGSDAHILLVDDSRIEREFLTRHLAEHHAVVAVGDDRAALEKARSNDFDLVMVNLLTTKFDPLRLCSQLRSQEETRQVPILVLVGHDEIDRMVKALDLGVSDYLMAPIDVNEMIARVRTQVRRKRYQGRLRANYQKSMALAVTDSLTGLYNRRYLHAHLGNIMRRSAENGRPVSVLAIDIDHFKEVNDTYGHAAGDRVLTEFASRMMRHVRGVDLIARVGGEEFVVVLPECDARIAAEVAERVRGKLAEQPVPVDDDQTVAVTVSIGCATAYGAGESGEALLKRADDALYRAKNTGRNRVELAKADGAGSN